MKFDTCTCAAPLTEKLGKKYVANTEPPPSAVAVKSPSCVTMPTPPVVDQTNGTSVGAAPFTISRAMNCWLCPTIRFANVGSTSTEYVLAGGLALSDSFGFAIGSKEAEMSLADGSEVGAGLTAGVGAMSPFTCDTPVPEIVAAPVEETAPPDLLSDEDETVEAPEDEATGDDAVAALSPFELAPIEAPAPLSDTAANASGMAKSSDTNAAKRNNLFIMIPPKTLIFSF